MRVGTGIRPSTEVATSSALDVLTRVATLLRWEETRSDSDRDPEERPGY